jgi:stress response protein YsnF
VTATPTRPGAATGDGTGRDEVIPVVREDVSVGKRVEERRQRIRAYVVEKPFEQQVTLRDERVVIERRPVSGERTATGPDAMREREFEVVERHEKPVVDKNARVVEEVVVHHEAGEHTETVRDKVRETRVDVDANKTTGPARNDPAAPTPRPGGTPPGNTRR